MNFGLGAFEGIQIIFAVLVIWAIPIAITGWVLRSIVQMRRKLDQIQSRLDAMAADLDARR